MNRRAIGIGAAVFVVFLLLWYFVAWNPQQSKLHKAQKRKEAAEQQADELTQAINRLRAAQRNEPLQRAQLELLRTAIPDDPNLGQFILDVNDRAAAAGIDFVSISPTLPTTAPTTTPASAASPTAPPAQITVSLQITGGYFQVIDFINRLADLPRILVLDTLNISAGDNVRLSVGISSRMFVKAVPAGFAAPGASPVSTTTTTAAGGATTTTAAGGATTTTAAGATTSTTGARP